MIRVLELVPDILTLVQDSGDDDASVGRKVVDHMGIMGEGTHGWGQILPRPSHLGALRQAGFQQVYMGAGL